MPKGELFINNQDAFEAWGVSMETGAVSALMTPAPLKGFVENKSRLEHGTNVVVREPRMEERTITLPMHIVARSNVDFLNKYERFCNDVLAQGVLTLSTRFQRGVTYKLVYMSCEQFSEFIMEYAAFSLKVKEPNPADRG